MEKSTVRPCGRSRHSRRALKISAGSPLQVRCAHAGICVDARPMLVRRASRARALPAQTSQHSTAATSPHAPPDAVVSGRSCRLSWAGATTSMMRQEPVDETVSCKDMVVREHGGELAIDPIGRGSGHQGLMVRGPRTGQFFILPVDGREIGGYGTSGPPGSRFAAIDRAKPARSSTRSSAGSACLMISSPPYSTLGCIPSRSDSPSCRKRGPCPPRSSELR